VFRRKAQLARRHFTGVQAVSGARTGRATSGISGASAGSLKIVPSQLGRLRMDRDFDWKSLSHSMIAPD